MTDRQSIDDPTWAECPSGEIGGLVQNLKSQRQAQSRRETIRQAATAISALAVLVMIGVYAVPHFVLSEPTYGGVTCSDVASLADEYLAQRLDGGMRERVEAHLSACPHCQAFIEELRSDSMPPLPVETGQHVAEQDLLIAIRSQ